MKFRWPGTWEETDDAASAAAVLLAVSLSRCGRVVQVLCDMPKVFEGVKGIRTPYASTNYRRALWYCDGHCWTSTEEQVRKQVRPSSL